VAAAGRGLGAGIRCARALAVYKSLFFFHTKRAALLGDIVGEMLLFVAVVVAWSGPRVRPVFNAFGISAIEIDGAATAPHFLVGNTQGGLDDDYSAWAIELKHASDSGVQIFGICPDGTDLLGPNVQLSNKTRSMVDRILATVPSALIIPRMPMGAGPSFPRTQIMSTNSSLPLRPLPYGSMTDAWAAAAAPRMASFLTQLDKAYPGHIAGVHLAGLASEELRYECPPEDWGYADYASVMVADFCRTLRSQHRLPTETACAAPSATSRCTPPPGNGNLFTSNISAEYNLFLSRQVQRAISACAAAAKEAMGGRGLVLAFYGYLNELGGHRVAGSGHLALGALLRDEHVDGIVSPYKYDAVFRRNTLNLSAGG
jgi:hypothetical protein